MAMLNNQRVSLITCFNNSRNMLLFIIAIVFFMIWLFDDGGWLMMSLVVIKQPHKTMMIHELGNPFLTSKKYRQMVSNTAQMGSEK